MPKKIILIILILFISCNRTTEQRLRYTPSEEALVINNPTLERKTPVGSFVTEFYEDVSSFYSDKTYLLWEEENEIIELLLSWFFKTEDSLIIDLKEELPFVTTFFSLDKCLSIHNWKKKAAFNMDLHNNILQFITPDNRLLTFRTSQMKNNIQIAYSEAYKIQDNIYILYGFEEGSRSIHRNAFIAIKIYDDMIAEYSAWDTDSFFVIDTDGAWPNINIGVSERIIGISFNFITEPFSIEITYGEIILNNNNSEDTLVNKYNTGTLVFIFDGMRFVGDYEKLNSLK